VAEGGGIALPEASAEAVMAALDGGLPRLQAIRARLLSRDAAAFHLRPAEMLAAILPYPHASGVVTDAA